MKNAIVGQLGVLVWRDKEQNAKWSYGVVEHVFDDRLQLSLEDGHRYMHVFSESGENEDSILKDQPTDSTLDLLYINDVPVMARKKLFGGYIVKPQ